MSATKDFLKVARSYYENGDKLIYTTLGNNFLRGGEIFDAAHNQRGRIDCSTFVHLTLQGISYENSPYVTGTADSFFHSDCPWADREILQRFIDGKPIKAAFKLAQYYEEKGKARTDKNYEPGDILFFQIKEEMRKDYESYGVYRAISHVAIVAEDGKSLYESSGNQTKNVEKNAFRRGVEQALISDKPEPVFYVRPFE